MAAIAGYLSHGGRQAPDHACDTMLSALTAFGPDGHECRCSGGVCFGRALRRFLPEDDFDHQPLTGAGGRFLLTADVRIDNRAELATKLAISSGDERRMSDAALLLRAWERWRLDCFDHLLGDVALAVWDAMDLRLTLARSAAGLKPLFYHQAAGFTAFASMPQAILALDGVPKRLDADEAAAMAGGLPYLGSSSIFEGIRRVRQGHAVELSGGNEKLIRHWRPERIAPASFKGDCAEALRAELERAVSAQLRRRRGAVASQLSSGRDSSAVATTAARILQTSGERLIALTGAPRDGFVGPSGSDRIADESGLAAITAKAHPNMDHVVCRTRHSAIAPAVRRGSSAHYGPFLNLSALHWSSRVSEQASASGASVLLIGSTGNFSISAGGISYLVDLLSYGGFAGWWAGASGFGGISLSRWRTIGSLSLGPFLPQPLYRLLLRASGRDPGTGFDVPILRQPYRGRAERVLKDYFSDLRPPRSRYEFRRNMLLRRENSEKMSEALWGLDPRDPTADRRLIELCLSFPPEALVSASSARPAYDAAFGDRIPRPILDNDRRGRQGADWFELFPQQELRELFGHLGRNRIVPDMLDLDYINRSLARWPTALATGGGGLIQYQNELLGALAMADFIDLHFPD
jgi:asparagine synthase (glutamine-hydrolysing)